MRIAVIGCGIAGQTAAIFLAGRGHAVSVFERFDRPAPVGAGLLLQPTGLAVLARLGLLEGARRAGAMVGGIDGRTIGGRKVLDLHYADLAAGCHGIGIHRASLFGLLHQRLLSTSARLVTGMDIIATDQRGDEVRLRVAGGGDLGAFDLALVCDGAHSQLRGFHAGRKSDPVYPWGCVWATVRDPGGDFAGLLRQRFAGTGVMIGVLPVGAGADGAGNDWVTMFWSLKVGQFDDFPNGGWEAWRGRLLALWPDLAPLVAQMKPDGFTRASYRDVALGDWRQGRVLFLGDAAHGTSPQLGQGANLAMLDAFHLARALDRPDGLETALDAFQKRRRRQVDFYRRASRWLTPFYQSDMAWLGWMRDLSFGLACRFPPTRNFMLTTLAGLRRGPLRADRPDPGGLAPLAP